MFERVEPKDYIRIDDWQKLAAEFGFVFASPEDIHAAFTQISQTSQTTTLVTACSDVGLTLQDAAHPNADLLPTAQCVDWQALARERDAYHQVQVGPPLRPEYCRPEDRYSLKTERYTWATFNGFPANLRRWYTTNLNIVHERLEWLPFGINNDGPGKDILSGYAGREKKHLLYVNVRPTSLERVDLQNHYSREPWVTFRPDNLPVADYYDELSTHKFALCPAGNGLDTYRLWECLYLGVIPIVKESIFSLHLKQAGLPVAVAKGLTFLEHTLHEQYEIMRAKTYEMSCAKLSYYRALFERAP